MHARGLLLRVLLGVVMSDLRNRGREAGRESRSQRGARSGKVRIGLAGDGDQKWRTNQSEGEGV